MSAWIDVAAESDVGEGEPLAVAADGLPVALFRLEGRLHALHDRCPHGAARLSGGIVENGCVECPLHQGLVDIVTGEPRSKPIRSAVRVLSIRTVAGRIEVEV